MSGRDAAGGRAYNMAFGVRGNKKAIGCGVLRAGAALDRIVRT